MVTLRQLSFPAAIALAILTFTTGSLRAQTGTIAGQVVDAGTLAPLEGAQVSIPARTIGALARANGRFVIPGVPVGTHVVEVRLIGYGVESREVTVVANQTVTLDVQLQSQAIALDELVVTGTGVVSERRQLGQTITALSTDVLESVPATNLHEALRGRVAGIYTVPEGELGGSAPIVLRGTVSLSQRNEPILYIDGVRVDNNPNFFASVTSSPLNQINPNDIERIEVIKGAAAATLYGTEASAGVIQIFTKRGTVGDPTYTFEIDQSATRLDESRIPGNWKWSAKEKKMYFNDPMRAEILRIGHAQNYSASVRGGLPSVQYFASGRFSHETANYPKEIGRQRNASGRLGLTFQHTEKLQTEVNLNVTRNMLVAPYPFFGLVGILLSDPANTNPGRPYGELFGSVKGALAHDNSLTTNHLVASGRANYRWTPNLSTQFTVGFNDVEEEGITFIRKGGEAILADGRRDVRNSTRRATTVEVQTSWEHGFGPNLTSTFLVGGQSFWENRVLKRAAVRAFAAPSLGTLRGGATITALDESFEEVINAGVFVQEQIGLWDRLFLTGGLRLDGNSAFGEDFGFQVYPKLGASWVVSDHDFWNVRGWDQLRLRAAIGAAGLQPGSFDAQRTWQPIAFLAGGVAPLNIGNPELGPERSIEREIAAEFGFLGGRVGLEVVYFNQETRDALLPTPFPPSSGFLQKQLTNVGLLESKGLESSLNVTWIQRRNFSLRTSTQLSWVDRNVADMAGVAPFRVQLGRRWSWVREGYAPGDIIAPVRDPKQPYVVTVPIDKLSSLLQIQPRTLKNAAGQDSLHYVGHSVPTTTGSFSLTADLPGGFSVSTLLTGSAGFMQVNETELIRESVLISPRAARWDSILSNPNTPTSERQRIADAYGPTHHLIIMNWAAKGDFIRLGEVAVTYDVPQAVLQRLGGGMSSMQLMLAGSNLALWSRYLQAMKDRESDAVGDPLMTDNDGEAGGNPNTIALVHNIDWFNFPAPRRYSLRLRVTF